jgi:hypothetical protein
MLSHINLPQEMVRREDDNDYSKWFFTLDSNYTSIKEGVNKITARLSCLPNVVGDTNNITKWYSINVTGTGTAEISNSTATLPPAPSSPVVNPSASVESEVYPHPDSDVSGKQDANDRFGEEIENLKDRILEQAEENLREQGIELNLR